MIERWLQVTCDGCGDTGFAVAPDATASEARRDTKMKRRLGMDLCQRCDGEMREKIPVSESNGRESSTETR